MARPAGPRQQLPSGPQAKDLGAAPLRGQKVILERMKNVVFGVSLPQLWSAQLKECEAKCKADVLSVVASCHASGQKFTDEEFPPSGRSLFVNGERPSASSKMPGEVHWRRASELCPAAVQAGAWALEVSEDSRLLPGAIDDTAFLGAVALLRAAQRTPEDLIVHHDLKTGVVGVRLFKDGEWTYELIDDYVPCCSDGGLACGRTSQSSEIWIALLEKANAKIHGSYEAVQRSTELEALEDLTSGAVRKLDRRELASGQAAARAFEARQRLGCLHMVARRRERRGEELASGLLAGHCYPVMEVDHNLAWASCRLENPWPRGGYRGRGGGEHSRGEASAAAGSASFDMGAEELVEHFTEVVEVRLPRPDWHCYRVTLSTDRPSYPLLSARTTTQCLLIASQPDRRWKRQDSYLNGLGLRVYCCRVRAPPVDQQGGRQDPKANPFEPLELVRRRPLGKTRSACLEFIMEPYALYIVSVDSQYRCPRCVLRFGCSSEVQFRELSAPEAGHFLAAQPGATQNCGDLVTLSARTVSDASMYSDSQGDEGCSGRNSAAERCGLAACFAARWGEWRRAN